MQKSVCGRPPRRQGTSWSVFWGIKKRITLVRFLGGGLEKPNPARTTDFTNFNYFVLYHFLRGFSLWQRGIDSTKQMTVLLVMVKKSKTRRGVRAGRNAFLSFFTHFYTLYKKTFIGYD